MIARQPRYLRSERPTPCLPHNFGCASQAASAEIYELKATIEEKNRVVQLLCRRMAGRAAPP